MGNIRRIYLPHTAVFLTTVCYQRTPYLQADSNKHLLLAVLREVKNEFRYRMIGYVIMDDHLHCMLLPDQPTDYPRIMQSVKLRFARRLKSRLNPSPKHIWQPRYWDHVIRDDRDLHRHLDYIHFNPVKHAQAPNPHAYPWSSFHIHLQRGHYPADWCVDGPPKTVADMDIE